VRERAGAAKIELMTIRIPDDIARELEELAKAQKKSAQEVAVERLRSVLQKEASPQALLRAIRALPHPSSSAVDELEAAIAESGLPVRDQGVFDTRPAE
jgi:gamma-glutamyl:cysteine ligase YbdK (ATP-grasp superfamily)